MVKRPRDTSARRSGFSLIELLVVIAIIALLISILLPALRYARDAAYTTKEMAVCEQLLVAYHTYAVDNKDRVLPPVAEYWWVWHFDYNKPPPPMPTYSDIGDRLYYLTAQPYGWRLAPYLGYEFQALVNDKQRLAEIRSLKRMSPIDEFDGFERAITWNTSFGMNNCAGIDVISDKHAGDNIATGLNLTNRLCVRLASDVILTDKYMLFVTARAYERQLNPADQPPAGARVLNGSYQVLAPFKDGRPVRYCASSSSVWNPKRSPNDFGNVDYRHSSRAIVGSFDGHTELMKLDQLRSMKRWSNAPGDWDLLAK